MGFLEAIGLGVLVVLVGLAVLFVRRGLFARGGGLIEVSVRLSSRVPGRGWAPGFGRFAGDDLRWYRMFSFALRPRRIFSRRQLAIQTRRRPEGAELLGLPTGSVILRCSSRGRTIEMAMTEGALTGFLSWLEAAPPGTANSRRLVG
jgi:hypothetical protein